MDTCKNPPSGVGTLTHLSKNVIESLPGMLTGMGHWMYILLKQRCGWKCGQRMLGRPVYMSGRRIKYFVYLHAAFIFRRIYTGMIFKKFTKEELVAEMERIRHISDGHIQVIQ